ncbi:MAG: hypothetical protein ACWGNV_02505 [Bacteroidales bacterium]
MKQLNDQRHRIFLLLILAVLSSEIFAMPLMDPERGPVSAFRQTGEDTFLAHADWCLDLMENAASEMSVHGVAVVAYIPGEKSMTWVSRMKVVGLLADENANFLSVAYSKAAEMAATYRNSGSADREPLHGEFGYEGGLIERVGSGYILAVFSGGTGEEDTEIARAGLEELKTAFSQ